MSKRSKPETASLIPELIRHWRKITGTAGPKEELQTREFRRICAVTNDILQGREPFEESKCLGAYLLYLWPLRYQEAFSVLKELPKLGKVLDLYSGLGAAGFAAMRLGAEETTLMHPNLRMLQLAAEFIGKQGYVCTLKRGEYDDIKERYDTIILSHQLLSLTEDPQGLTENILSHLTPEGHLVLIEDSQSESNRAVLKLRDGLVEKGFAVQAPCVWKGPCPARAGKFPCFAQREMEKPYLLKEIQRKLEINLNSLKMSYLIIKARGATSPQLEGEAYRVVSPKFETEEGKVVYLCGTPGKRKLFSRLPQAPKSAKAFDYLRRGDLLTVDKVAGKNALQLLENSDVKVIAACGKPLPEVM